MSRIKFSQNLSGARGSLGGSVLTYGKCGSVIRTKSSNTNKNSLPQNKQRVLFTTIVKLWNTLSDLQRSLWDYAAKSISNADALGNVTILNGFDYFKLCNMNLYKCNRPIIIDAPKLSNIFTFDSIDVTIRYTANEINLNFLPVLPVDTDVLVFATAPHGNGIINVKNLFRFVMVLNSTYASPYNCIDEYINTFGGIGTDGQKIVFRFIPVSVVSGCMGVVINRSVLVLPACFIIGSDVLFPPAGIGFFNKIRLFPIVAGNSGTVNYYSVYGRDHSGTGVKKLKCALYDSAFNLVVNSVSEEILMPIVNDWHQLNIIGVKPIINAGFVYWLAAWGNGSIVYINGEYPVIGIKHRCFDKVYSGIFPASIPLSIVSAICTPSFYGTCSF